MAALDGGSAGRVLLPGWAFAAGAVFAASVASHFRAPLLPAIGHDLAMSAFALGLVTTLFGLGRLVTDIPAGHLTDRLGPRGMFAAAGTVIAVGSTAFALAPVAGWVLASSLVLGVASAMANTAGMTYFLTHSARARRGRAMAAFSAALLVGQAIGPTLAGWVASAATWRTAMGIAALLGTGLMVGGGAALARLRRQAAGFSGAGAPGLTGTGIAEGASAGGAASAPAGPVAPAGMGASARWALYGVSFAMMFTLGAMPQTLVPIIGGDRLGLNLATIGAALGIGGLARLVGTLVGGWLSDRFARKAVLVPGLAVYGAGVALLMVEDSVVLWFASIVLMSLASFGIATASAMIGDRVEPDRVGREIGVFRFVGDVGLLIGPMLSAYVLGAVGQPAAVSLGAGVVFASTAALVVLVPTRG